MKRIGITFCLAMVALSAMAQKSLSLYTKVGIGTSYFWGKDSNSQSRMAHKAAIGAQYLLNKTWAIQSGVEFVSIGGKDHIANVGYANMNELYLQLPLMVTVRFQPAKNYYVSLSGGPYIAVGVGGKTSGATYYIYNEGGDYAFEEYPFLFNTFGSMLDGNMGNDRFDAGLAMAITFEYRRFTIAAEGQIGFVRVNRQLNSLMQSQGNGYLPKNMASFFTLGYRF